MNIPIKLIVMSTLLINSIAKAQQPSMKPLDADLTEYQYPYPVHFITLTIQGEVLKMAYMDVKPVNPNGHVIMLLHGKNFNGFYWGETAKVLSDSGYRVIIPDQIGFGKSSKPEHIQYSFQLLSENTKAILDSLGIKKGLHVGAFYGWHGCNPVYIDVPRNGREIHFGKPYWSGRLESKSTLPVR